MFEIIFILGCLTWLMDLLIETLYPLPVFATLATALVAIPTFAFLDYHIVLSRQFLTGVGQDRTPVPPERFRWKLVRPRWKSQIITCLICLPFGWLPIFWFPARAEISLSSLVGWVCGGIAIASSAWLVSRGILYFRIAQWFDIMTPRIARWFWEMMYWISDNHDFLPAKIEIEEPTLLTYSESQVPRTQPVAAE